MRLARKLGFDGYPALRSQLRAEMVAATGPAERMRQRLALMAEDSILGSLVESEISALHELTRHVSQLQIDAAAEAIIAAREVFVFGQGNATSLVDMMQRRLRRSGIRTTLLSQRNRDIAERIVVLEPEDLVLAFAFHSVPHGLAPLFEHAADIGAARLLVSDVIGPLVRPRPTILLAAPRGTDGAYLTQTVPMAICNALVLGISRLDQGRSLRALDRLTSLMSKFDNDRSRASEDD